MTQENTDGLKAVSVDVTQDSQEEIETPTDIIPRNETVDQLLMELRDTTLSHVPIHEQILASKFDIDEREEMANLYYGLEPQPFNRVAGQELDVLGLIIFESGPYRGKDGLYHPEGYYQVRIVVLDRHEEPMIVKSGSKSLLPHGLHAANKYGWFLFEKPVKYRFSLGENNSHRMFNTEHDYKKRLAGRKVNV